MRASRNKIFDWLIDGKSRRATHVIIVRDGFDYTDYPVYVHPGQRADDVADIYKQKDMQRVIEVVELAEVFSNGY